eukprot:TRINITY_DN29232_c0_g1_i2.p1 TRINITY_DN29232_c0_g1~~TRINITY_DN29232_c0_g1_i2.p1  ORF type:complete len:880 (+),score=221.05 TRINITY_DN29232_c0_g1_i2:83-2722(+)
MGPRSQPGGDRGPRSRSPHASIAPEFAVTPSSPVARAAASPRRSSVCPGSARNSVIRLSISGSGGVPSPPGSRKGSVAPAAAVRRGSALALARRRSSLASRRGTAAKSRWHSSTVERPDAAGEERLPSVGGKDIRCLPYHLRETCLEHARERICVFLIPRLKLHQKKQKRRRAGAAPERSLVTPDLLRKQKMFSLWPQQMLAEIVSLIKMTCYDAGEYVFYDGEPGTHMVFLLSGQVEVVKRIPGSGKNGVALLAVLSPVVVIGEFSVLTEERRIASVRTTAPTVCAVLLASDFQRFMPRLPPHVLSEAMEFAFGKRRETMALAPPLPATFRCCAMFNPCPDRILLRLQKWVSPLVVPKRFVLTTTGAVANKIFLLVSGRCEAQRGHREATLRILEAPSMIDSVAVFSGSNSAETVRTLCTAELWVLPRDRFIECTQPEMATPMMDAVRMIRQDVLRRQPGLFLSVARKIPLLNACFRTSERVEGIEKLFDACILKPLSMVVHRSGVADRIIFLHRGRVVMLPSRRQWPPGDSIGWTCLVPHRWGLSAVAQTTTELLVVNREKFLEFVQQHGCEQVVLKWTQALLFPCSVSVPALREAEEQIAGLSFHSFPISTRSVPARFEPEFIGDDLLRTQPDDTAVVAVPSPPPPPTEEEAPEDSNELRAVLDEVLLKHRSMNKGKTKTPDYGSMYRRLATHVRSDTWLSTEQCLTATSDMPCHPFLLSLDMGVRGGLRALRASIARPSISTHPTVIVLAAAVSAQCASKAFRPGWRPAGRCKIPTAPTPRRQPRVGTTGWVDRLYPQLDPSHVVVSAMIRAGRMQPPVSPPPPPSWAGIWPAPPTDVRRVRQRPQSSLTTTTTTTAAGTPRSPLRLQEQAEIVL